MQTAPASTALLSDPAQAFLALAVVVCAIVWLSGQPVGRRLCSVLPTPLWIFVLPMALTTAGVLPQASEAYEVMAVVLVPTSLFLLAASSDFRSTLRTGPLAVLILAAGTLGVCAGGIASFALTGDALGEEGWKGFAVLSGAWIGGSANAIAVQQGLDADPSVISHLAPMAQGLLGKRVGDQAVVKLPDKTEAEYTIVAIENAVLQEQESA